MPNRLAMLMTVGLAFAANAQAKTFDVLSEYAAHGVDEVVNTPEDEVAWLKKNQLTHGELDNFPTAAIVLHRVDVEKYLNALGFEGSYTKISYGFTDPTVVYLVRKVGTAPFAVAEGLPGAGGITTEVAELHAMGVTTIIHVGTCGLLSPELAYGQVIISGGSYKDGAAFLLDRSQKRQISRPDTTLADRIDRIMDDAHIPHVRALGFAMPIYYYQPTSVLRDLLTITGPEKPQFIEMEEAAFFSVAKRIGITAGSLVVGSDRLESHDGKFSQGFWNGDLDALELLAFREAVQAIVQASNAD